MFPRNVLLLCDSHQKCTVWGASQKVHQKTNERLEDDDSQLPLRASKTTTEWRMMYTELANIISLDKIQSMLGLNQLKPFKNGRSSTNQQQQVEILFLTYIKNFSQFWTRCWMGWSMQQRWCRWTIKSTSRSSSRRFVSWLPRRFISSKLTWKTLSVHHQSRAERRKILIFGKLRADVERSRNFLLFIRIKLKYKFCSAIETDDFFEHAKLLLKIGD